MLSSDTISSALVKELAMECGFSLCGIARVDELVSERDYLRRWIDSGKNSVLGYMERNFDKRLDPRLLVDGCQIIVVCAVNYKNQAWAQPHDPLKPKVASYALAKDYHHTIKAMLNELLARLKNYYPNIAGRCFTDSAPVFEKAWAVRAGLGWVGRNSLLVTPSYGSFVLLGELIINLQADLYDDRYENDDCNGCSLCLDSCPTGAISADSSIDTRLCISRATQYPIPGDIDTRGWIVGCEECQQCCPHNLHTPMHTNREFDICNTKM